MYICIYIYINICLHILCLPWDFCPRFLFPPVAWKNAKLPPKRRQSTAGLSAWEMRHRACVNWSGNTGINGKKCKYINGNISRESISVYSIYRYIYIDNIYIYICMSIYMCTYICIYIYIYTHVITTMYNIYYSNISTSDWKR